MISQSQRDYVERLKAQKVNLKAQEQIQKNQESSQKSIVDNQAYDKLSCVAGKARTEKFIARLDYLERIDKQYRKVFQEKKKEEQKKEFSLFPLLA